MRYSLLRSLIKHEKLGNVVKNLDVLIIGGGLAGLNAAIHCQSRGANVKVLEASDRPGGRVASDVIDGFICDRGFQLINAKYPALNALQLKQIVLFVNIGDNFPPERPKHQYQYNKLLEP